MQFTDIKVTNMLPIASESALLVFVGQVAGECYNSDMTDNKCVQRALNCIKRGHHSPWEHVNITLKCTVDRGVSHALVRHRHCAFQQSSTIYQKYKELTFIRQQDMTEDEKRLYGDIEKQYIKSIDTGVRTYRARNILPNILMTNLIITTNVRQWMYMVQRRRGPGDSDTMHEWARQTYAWFVKYYPMTTAAFDEWYAKHPL